MKCYVLMGTAWAGKNNRIVMAVALKVFASEELGENYIHETWPEAQYRCDDDFGKHWVLEPDENFTWRARYKLEEMEIEGL